jgi:hypothetical protein
MSSTKEKTKTKTKTKAKGTLQLKHKHDGFTANDTFSAAMHIALKEPNSFIVSKSKEQIVVQKIRTIDRALVKMFGLPSKITYQETWKLQLEEDMRFLVSAQIFVKTYQLSYGSMYTTEVTNGHPAVRIQSKVDITGLDGQPAMLSLVQTFVRAEFGFQRRRERKYMKRARKNKLKNGEIESEEEEEEEDRGAAVYEKAVVELMATKPSEEAK